MHLVRGLLWAIHRPGEELERVGRAAAARWRDGRRPVVAVVALSLCVLSTAAYRLRSWRPAVEAAGGVRASLPLPTELARLPASAFLPTPELPLVAACVQVLVVFGLAELLWGRAELVSLAAAAQVISTLLARALIIVGPATVIGLSAAQAQVLDTGPSVMTAALGGWLLVRQRARWCLGLLAGGLLVAGVLQPDIDGREHLAALVCGLLLPPLAGGAFALGVAGKHRVTSGLRRAPCAEPREATAIRRLS